MTARKPPEPERARRRRHRGFAGDDGCRGELKPTMETEPASSNAHLARRRGDAPSRRWGCQARPSCHGYARCGGRDFIESARPVQRGNLMSCGRRRRWQNPKLVQDTQPRGDATMAGWATSVRNAVAVRRQIPPSYSSRTNRTAGGASRRPDEPANLAGKKPRCEGGDCIANEMPASKSSLEDAPRREGFERGQAAGQFGR